MKNSITKEILIKQKHVKKLFNYDPYTGKIIRRITRGRTKAGDVAGWLENNGYRRIQIGKITVLAHRLVWLYMTGEWPNGDVDHKNGVGDDNRWDNLREGNKSFNMQNQRKARIDNKSGVLGVSIRGNKYRARITLDNKIIYLGTYSTAKEAHNMYLKAKRKLHDGCTI